MLYLIVFAIGFIGGFIVAEIIHKHTTAVAAAQSAPATALQTAEHVALKTAESVRTVVADELAKVKKAL